MLQNCISAENRAALIAFFRRAALVVVPMIGMIAFAGLLVWSFRRMAMLPEKPLVETTEEPPYEVPAEPVAT